MAFLGLLAAILFSIAVLRRPRAHRRRGVPGALRAAAPYAGVLLATPGVIALWYFHRPQPPPRREALFRGITYERVVQSAPFPMVAHVARIDLREPSISFVVTPHEGGGRWLRAATTSQFLEAQGVQLAVNGDFFLPWWSDGPDDFYPRAGQPTDALGASVSDGVAAGWRVAPYSALVFGLDGGVSIVEVRGGRQALPPARHAVSGKHIVVDEGRKVAAVNAMAHGRVRHPRTAAALDQAGATLILVVVDGRQPGHSEGATLEELAEVILAHGGHRAVNLDGGGSSAMVADGGEGVARVLSVPIHTRIPWRQRPVANHLGVRAQPL